MGAKWKKHKLNMNMALDSIKLEYCIRTRL